MNDNHSPNHNGAFTDPPEGLQVLEFSPNQKFKIREFVSWSIKGVVAVIYLIAIAIFIVLVMKGSVIKESLEERFGDVPELIPQVVRGLLAIVTAYLFFRMMKLLFGVVEIRGTATAITSYCQIFGIPMIRSMGKGQFQSVELQYRRGHVSSSDAGNNPGRWSVKMMGRRGSLELYETGSLEEAKWLGNFVADWYGLETERKGDKRKFRW